MGGAGVNVAEGVVSLGVGATSVAFAVTVGRASVGLGLGAGVFVDTGLGSSFVGVGSTIALAKTLASGDGVSAI